MRRLVTIASIGVALGACAQLIDLDGVVWRGGEEGGSDDAGEGGPPAEGGADAPPGCDGPCSPATLFVASGLEPTLATDGKSVFVRAGGEIESCPVTGCAAPSHVWTASAPSPRLVAASATHVYWNDGNAVYGCAGGAACGTPSAIVDLGSFQLTGLAASPASSWVLASGSSGGTLRVLRGALDGSAQVQVASQSVGGGSSGAVVAVPASSRVYWAEDGAPAIFDCLSPPCATPDHNTVALATSPLGLAATIDSVFFGTTSGLWIADKDLATARPFAGSGTVDDVVLTTQSEATVYFVESSGTSWTIASCPTTGCASPTTLHATTTPVTALAADEASLYFIEGDAVRRLAVP